MKSHSLLAVVALTPFVSAQASLEPFRVQASATDASYFEVRSLRDEALGPSRSYCGFQTPGGADNLFEFGWFFRVAGDASQSAFHDDPASMQMLSTPPTYDAGPPAAGLQLGTMSLSWGNVDERGFDADWLVAVQQNGVDQAEATHTLTINNPQPGPPLTIEIFLFMDADIDGALVDSDNRQTANGRFAIDDLFTDSFLHVAADPLPDHWEVGAFGSGLDARIAGPTYDLADTGLPFGPGDWTGAMQWSLTIPAFSFAQVEVVLGRNVCPNPAGVTAAATNYGVALPGANGPMQLVSLPPFVGQPYDVFVGNGPQFGTATILVGSAPLAVSICSVSILVDQWATLAVPLDIVGSGVLELNTPCDPLLNGLQLFMQAFAIDPTSQSVCYPLVHSSGLQATFGS